MDDKYQELHRSNFVYPYFYKVTNGKQFLYFVGPHHSYDPRNPQHKKIQQYWDNFLNETKKLNCISLTEGGKRGVAESPNEAIINDAEAGLVTYLSEKNKIRNISPEPKWLDEIKELRKQFTQEDIALHDFVRVVAQWNRLTKKPDFNRYINRFSTKYFEGLKWNNFDFSVENLIRAYETKTGNKFDKNDYESFHLQSSPQRSKVACVSSMIRDNHILNVITDLWKKNYNIFVVYGSGHAIVLEPALKKLLT